MMPDFRKNGKLELRCTMGYGTPLAHGSSEAKAPLLAMRPVAGHFPQKSH